MKSSFENAGGMARELARQRAAIIKVAADLALCYGMPPTDPADWDFDPATPYSDRVKILDWARAAQSQCKFWARKLKDIADPLPQVTDPLTIIEEMAGSLEDYQKATITGLLSRHNADVDLPDTAAQDSASKPNNPAVSG